MCASNPKGRRAGELCDVSPVALQSLSIMLSLSLLLPCLHASVHDMWSGQQGMVLGSG
jgi:hypothetical protein